MVPDLLHGGWIRSCSGFPSGAAAQDLAQVRAPRLLRWEDVFICIIIFPISLSVA